MMRIRDHLILLVLFCLLAVNTMAQQGVVPGVIRIKLSPDKALSAEGLNVKVRNGIATTGITTLDNLNKTYSVTGMKRVFPYSPKFEERHRKHGLHLWYEISYTSKATGVEIMEAYKATNEVENAQQVFVPVLFDGKYTPAKIPNVPNKAKGALPFNDPGLPDQWHYINTGQYGGIPGMDINLINAWTIEKGSKNITVAVFDQGVDYKHEDLAANMWVNKLEAEGLQGKDDDGNGYIDDIHGFNFTTNYGEIDKGQHGTHVAGTVAAVNNNGIGMCGVAGGGNAGDGVRIMSCEILGNKGGSIEEAYVYAADNGVIISQNSWGYTYGGSPETNKALYEAIDYFIDEAGNYPGSPMKGGVVIFAAGNSNTDMISWPGAYERIVCVSSLGASGQKADYSNFGNWVDIAAPGGSSGVERHQGVLSTVPDNKYAYMDGTSMACPHVSGVAALIVSKFGNTYFTNNDLKKHLLTGVDRKIYTLEANADYADVLGIGLSDAFLALATDKKIAPNAIADVTLDGISQDFAQISWSVPSDNDDIKPWSFQVLYSIDEQFVFAKSVTVQNLKNVGNKLSVEIPELTALTKYYFTVRSIDRWGNVSENGNIVTGTTNSGPVTVLNPATLALGIKINISPTGKSTFTIGNTGEGILRYKITKYHVSSADKYSATEIQFPFWGRISKERKPVLGAEEIETPQNITTYAQTAINPVKKIEYTPTAPRWILGEMDTTISNSAANRFLVEDENGFNLTDIDIVAKLDKTRPACVVEIYQGENLSTAKLVWAQNYKFSGNLSAALHSIKLESQLFFEKGTYFWIAFHVPSGHLYPLGASYENVKGQALNSYMSNNFGKSWSRLVDVYWDTRLVWQITAVSKLEPIQDFIILNPDNGTLISNTTPENITIDVDGANLINGTYKENLIVYTNEPGKPFFKIPYTITVDNQQPKITLPDMIDFGSVMIGTEKYIDIVIPNDGLGRLKNIVFSYSNSQFTTVTQPYDIAAKGTGTLRIKYKPTTVGSVNAVVTIKAKDQNVSATGVSAPNNLTYTFVVNGVGVNPPVINLNPVSNSWTNVSIGTIIDGSLTITNTGSYPLKYYVPGKANSNLESESIYTHKYGYTYTTSNLTTYPWTDISTTGIDVTDKLKAPRERDSHFQVPMGIVFPFFGKNEENIYITRMGILTFDTKGAYNNNPYSYKQIDKGYGPGNDERNISALGTLTVNLGLGGKVYYKQYVDRFVVQYTNIPMYYGTATPDYITFQIVLFDNGDIHYYYKDVNRVNSISIFRNNTVIDIEDLSMNDAMPIHVQKSDAIPTTLYSTIPASGTAYIISCPGKGIVNYVDKPVGVIPIGGSTVINYKIDTKSLSEGSLVEKLNFVSNDIITPTKTHLINLNVNSGGTYNIALSTNNLDFGTIPQSGVKTMSVALKNSGTKNATITSATFNNSNFSMVESYTDLKCGRTLPFVIQINSSAVNPSLTGVLTITTNEPKTYTVNLTGAVIEPAKIEVVETSIDKTLESGATTTATLTIKNTGTNVLEYSATGNQWLQIDNSTFTANSTNSDYAVSTSTQSTNAPTYNWIDINATGTKFENWEDPIMDPSKSFIKVDLPWEFEYYGEKHTSLYVHVRGVISMESYTNENYPFGWGPLEYPMPNANTPNNFIAPLLTFGAPSNLGMPEDFPNAGVYYKIFDDKFVVTYNWMFNNFGMGDPMSFQVILYKDGRIKFQYQNTNYAELLYAQAGIENQDGTKGFEISNRTEGLILPKMAVLFTPVKKHTLAAGAQETININVSAEGYYAGSYTGKLNLINNSPDKANLSIPSTLTVTGAPAIQTSQNSFNFGEVNSYKYYNQDYAATVWTEFNKTFYVRNTGTSNLIISDVKVAAETPQITSVQAWFVQTGPWGGAYWTDVHNFYPALFPLTIAPGDSFQFRTELFDPKITPNYTGPFNAINNNITITGNFNGGTLNIPVTATPKFPAKILVDRSKIEVTTNDPKLSKEELLVITNNQVEGGFNLNYDLSIEYKRNIAASSVNTTSNTVRTANNNYISKLPENSTGYKVAAEKSLKASVYNRTLEYNTDAKAANVIGYNGAEVMVVGTAFKAPANGFNLTHVSTWYAPGTVKNSRITVEIKTGGTSIMDATTVYTQISEYVSEAEDKTGKLVTIKLDKNISIFPNEPFYVIYHYPIQAGFPQGYALVDQTVKGRDYFIIYQNTGDAIVERWSDLTDYEQFAKYSFIIKAHEETYLPSGWVTLNSSANGSIAANSTTNTVSMQFNANAAEQGSNTAKLIIKTNDPIVPTKVVDLKLYLNQSPKFDCGNSLNLTVAENSVLTYKVKAGDPETNTITTVVDPMARLTSAITGNTVEFTYSPNFDDAGVHTFNIKATDEFGAASVLPVSITVIHTNRAPVATAVTNKTLYSTNGYFTIKATDVFADPDGDAMTYAVETDNANTIAALTKESFIFNPANNGVSKITLTATDIAGASTSTSFNITSVINHAPVAGRIEDQNLILTMPVKTTNVSVSNAFTDVDNDNLTYTVVNADTLIASVKLSGNTLIVTPAFPGNTLVTVNATDNKGGYATTTFVINVSGAQTATEGADAVLNNVFSPNGDGMNDTWKIDMPQMYENCTFFIYNSVGEQVFYSYGYNTEWNGKDGDSELPAGTYYYIVKFPDGSTKNGTIAIVK